MPSTDSDGEDEKGRVNLVLPLEQKQKWENYADEHSVVDSLSALVRMSVEQEIRDDQGMNTEQIREVIQEEVGKQEDILRENLRETKAVRESQLSNDDVVNMVTTATIANDDYFDLVKSATKEGMREESIKGLEMDVLRAQLGGDSDGDE
jgi:hypothetical protein